MAPRNTRHLDLSTFDGKLLDGLKFCARVYDFFDQTKKKPNGLERLRLRNTEAAKKLVEELLPIARFVQLRHREGRRIKVRWVNGNQSFDAVLCSSGGLVTEGMALRRQLVEVTTATHSKEYLDRRLFHETGMSWGPHRIRQDEKTKQIVSEPYVYENDERSIELADQILERIRAKTAKGYPPGRY